MQNAYTYCETGNGEYEGREEQGGGDDMVNAAQANKPIGASIARIVACSVGGENGIYSIRIPC